MHPDINEIIPCFNPTNQDFTKSVETTTYTIPKRQSISVPRYIARHLARHLANKMTENDPVITQEAQRNAVKLIINE